MTDIQDGMDRLTDALAKIVAQTMPAILDTPEMFYVVSVRDGRSWNLGTGRPDDWHADTIALAEAETLRALAAQTDVILAPPADLSVVQVVASFNDILASLTRDLLLNADRKDPT